MSMRSLTNSNSENFEPTTPTNQKIQLKKRNTPSVLNSAKKKLGSLFNSSEPEVWHPIGRPSNVQKQCSLSEDLEWSGNAFTIGKQIGSGSFATVFLGRHHSLGMQFAIKKVPLPSGKNWARQKESLEREIQVLKDCRSPHIVSYFGSFQDPEGKNMCIVMEFLPGGTLQEVIKEYGKYGGLEEDHMRNVLGSVLKGLAYLHKLNIMHRDLKSKNILIDADGGTKLADFGVSRELNQQCMARSMVGTPLFMAPEILEGEPYGYRADVWSLGIVALHVANGEIPRRGTPVRELMRMVVAQPAPTVAYPQHWSPEFSLFVAACLVKNPAKRADCDALLESSWIRGVGEDSEHTKATMKGRTIGRASMFNEKPQREMTPNKLMQQPAPQQTQQTPQKHTLRAPPSTPTTAPRARSSSTPQASINAPIVQQQVRPAPVAQAPVNNSPLVQSSPSPYEDQPLEDVVKELQGWKKLALKLLDEREGKSTSN